MKRLITRKIDTEYKEIHATFQTANASESNSTREATSEMKYPTSK